MQLGIIKYIVNAENCIQEVLHIGTVLFLQENDISPLPFPVLCLLSPLKDINNPFLPLAHSLPAEPSPALRVCGISWQRNEKEFVSYKHHPDTEQKHHMLNIHHNSITIENQTHVHVTFLIGNELRNNILYLRLRVSDEVCFIGQKCCMFRETLLSIDFMIHNSLLNFEHVLH